MGGALFQPFPVEVGRRAQSWRHRPDHRKPRHFHAEPEINVVFTGWAKLGLGRDEVTLGPGDFVFFPPGQDHELLDASADLDLFVFALAPDLADSALGARVLGSSRGRQLLPHVRSRWEDRLLGLVDVRSREPVETSLVELFREAGEHVVPGHSTSRRALGEILESPELSASDLAERLRTHRSELSRQIHEAWGVPLVELRARTKLMRFLDEVSRGTELTRAALAAGFGSYAQCHRTVRRLLGCSPSEFARAEGTFKGRRS